jgi:hypothetical protein
MAQCVESLSVLYNNMHLQVVTNDDKVGSIKVTCLETLSSHGHLQKLHSVESAYEKL